MASEWRGVRLVLWEPESTALRTLCSHACAPARPPVQSSQPTHYSCSVGQLTCFITIVNNCTTLNAFHLHISSVIAPRTVTRRDAVVPPSRRHDTTRFRHCPKTSLTLTEWVLEGCFLSSRLQIFVDSFIPISLTLTRIFCTYCLTVQHFEILRN